MALATFYSASPLTLNATTVAAEDIRLSFGVISEAVRHSGNLFPSVQIVPGAVPRLSARVPFAEAYALIGLSSLKITTLGLYFSKFVDGVKSASSVHRKYALASSASGHAIITGARAEQNGILWADIDIVFLSADGMTHPLSASDNNALPAVSAEPALRSIGPVSVNGTSYFGVVGAGIDLGNKLETFTGDGHLYPTVAAFVGGDPVISIDTADPATTISGIGSVGAAASSNIVAYFRDYSTSTHLSAATGISMTIASGRVMPEDFGASSLGVARGSIRAVGLSTSSTHPVVVATGATLPTP